MANENDKIDELEDLEPSNDSTDLKSRVMELENKISRHRDSRKTMKEQYESEIAGLKAQLKITSDSDTKDKSNEFGLLEKTFLRSAGFTDSEEIELFKKWSEETKKPLDVLVDHPFVKAEIETMRTAKANQAATSGIKGEGGVSGAKDTPDYWIAKGELPEKTPQNRKLRANLARAMMAKSKEGSKFYNE